MIFSCSKTILFVLFVASSLLFNCAEPHDDNPTKTTSIKRRLIIRDRLNDTTITSESSNKVELKIRDDSAITQNSSSNASNPIVQVIFGILIGIFGIIVGVGCSFYCLRKQGYAHPSENVVKGARAIPKDFGKHTLGSEQNPQHQQKTSKASPYYSGESEDDSSFKHEQKIIITQHGPASDLSESGDFQGLSPNSQTIYGSQHASTSMVDLASPNVPISIGGQEMTRSRSR